MTNRVCPDLYQFVSREFTDHLRIQHAMRRASSGIGACPFSQLCERCLALVWLQWTYPVAELSVHPLTRCRRAQIENTPARVLPRFLRGVMNRCSDVPPQRSSSNLEEETL